MPKPIFCFVSFCESDGNPDELSVLLAELKKQTQESVTYLISHDLDVGAIIEKHEAAIETLADAFMVIGTPEYKRRVDMRELKTGVSREFQTYLRRKDMTSNRNPLVVIPVVWRGDFDTSLPLQFEAKEKAIDLSRFLTYSTERGRRLSADSQRQVAGPIKKIAQRLLAIHAANVGEETREQAYTNFDISYFRAQKREREMFENFRHDLFVQTRQFLRVAEQEEFLLIGRRGPAKPR
jgi:hypothetical protein